MIKQIMEELPAKCWQVILKEMKGKQVVGMEIYNKGDTDMTGQLMKLKNSNPQPLAHLRL